METTIFGLLCLVIISVVFSGIAYSRQQRLEQMRALVRRTKATAKEMETVVGHLVAAGCDRKLISLMGKYWITLINQAMTRVPDDPGLEQMLKHARQELESILKSETRPKPAENDGELRRLQGFLNEALKLMKRLRAQDRIPEDDLAQWEPYLRKMFVEVEVEAHLAIADASIKDNLTLTAIKHLNIAKDKLVRSTAHGDEKKPRAEKIGEKIQALFDKTAEENAAKLAAEAQEDEEGELSQDDDAAAG